MFKQRDMNYEWKEISSFMAAAGIVTVLIAIFIQ